MKVGIVGASFARAAYLPALRHVDGAEVVALASGRLESAQSAAAEFGVPAAYDDWQEMLNKHQLDLVLIATPTDLHAPITLAALDKGAHVLCEKPTAMDVNEATAMLDKAEALGRLHMIDHELRFNPNRAKVAAMIANGDLGDIRHVNIANIGASWANPSARPKGDWWSLAEHGGGRLGANGSHQVDMLRWWLGPVASVVGQALTVIPDRLDKATGEPWTATADDLSYFTLQMQSGALAQVFMSGVAANNIGNLTQVFGSRGTILLDNDDEKLMFAKAGGSFEDITAADPNAALPGVSKGVWNVSVVDALRELSGAINEGRKLRAGATFFDGLANQRVLDAVKQSTTARAWVDLPAERN
ncbi:Gfo/Idh/MocA family protein [Devosia psychrophila]|jgi:predicted dehydrogenase|uniref:Oxidoreductase n=1 Tax=Devosia psychrophila TaxID=728005 RepID=A0A0F5PXT7_9HYPH|nr:Gfo/Idh/MocA family oxidoreductase [Devosia psychrophila]KKC33487.1 oxidoreductase [Devosia psychrophila]SFD15216.1 Predicted dehydrogenase [Devosia psychrophila]